mgnify:CR=1 FL=1
MVTTQNSMEIQFLTDALAVAREARRVVLREIKEGKRVLNFMELRQLDMDIKTTEDELRRST